MKKKILIIGSTGKLGTKLLKFLKKNNIPIYCATCFNNKTKIKKQIKTYNIKNFFILNDSIERSNFMRLLEKKIDIIYFLDYGSYSLFYLNHFLNHNNNSIIAIANKELIIAGGSNLQTKIIKTKNKFIPLDSEHFSLLNSNMKPKEIKKIYITASGGPFYFNKQIKLSNVKKKMVLSHPKWNMGTNNLIDSSNFLNKVLEIYELSYIFNVPTNKIDFLICKEAYVHSVIHYVDNTISINCFSNDMLITLIKPLSHFYKINSFQFDQKYLNLDNIQLLSPIDKRFKIFKYFKKLLKFNHSQQIMLMIINNYAHKLYLTNKLKYNMIIPYIMSEIKKHKNLKKINSINSIIKFISNKNNIYKTNV